MLNVHASGGRAMLTAAREAVDRAAAGGDAPLLIAVTVLTSLSDADLRDIGFAGDAATSSARLATLAQSCGLDGVVCSAREAAVLRSVVGRDFKLVTPGIRLAGAAKDDQTRITTPEMAVKEGADYLVIGRPVTHATDPAATLAAINASLAKVAA
jgi:orotidine-5'-phosphate decarboxylase